MRWLLTAVIGVVGAIGAYYGVNRHTAIEAGIAERAQAVLDANPNYDRVSLVESRGRVAYLEGRLIDQNQANALEDAIGNEWGVRDVDLTGVELVALIDDPADYGFSAAVSGDEVKVTGLAGSRAQADALAGLAAAALGASPEQISISLADPEPEGWAQSVSAGLASLSGLQGGGTLDMSGTGAVLSGTATSADAYRAAQAFPQVMAEEATMPGELGGLNLALDPFTFSAGLDADGLSLSGGQPDAAALAEVEAYGATKFPGLAVNSDMLASDGVPSAAWVADSKAAIDALGSFSTGSALLNGDSLALSGTLRDGAAQGQTLEDIQGRLSGNLAWDGTGAEGIYYTNRDEDRDALFSTIGSSTLETDGGFVLPVPGFPISAQECVAQQERVAGDYPLLFAENADMPMQGTGSTLDALAGIQVACGEALDGWEIQLTGHGIEAEDDVDALALTRAENIKAALVERGANPDLLLTAGSGSSDPASTTDLSRRVDMSFVNRAELDRLAAEEAARIAAEEARLAAEAEARAARAAAIADALGGVSGFEEVNSFTLPIASFNPSVSECGVRFSGLLNTYQILFDSGSAALSTDSRDVVDSMAGIARRCESDLANAKVEISGHTDSQGDDASNLALSQRRADAVLAALAERGVETSAYSAVGYGETRPTADNSTAEG